MRYAPNEILISSYNKTTVTCKKKNSFSSQAYKLAQKIIITWRECLFSISKNLSNQKMISSICFMTRDKCTFHHLDMPRYALGDELNEMGQCYKF